MSVKVKILSENKKKKIDEMVDLLSDPTMLTLGVGGLALLYKMFFGSEPDLSSEEALNRARESIMNKVKQANAGNKDYKAKKDADQKRYKAQLDDLKKQRAMNLPPIDEPSDAIGIPMQSDADVESSNVKVPSADVVRRFAKAKKIADDPRAATGDANNAQRKVDKMREEYPGIDDHPDIKLYEAFVRFI